MAQEAAIDTVIEKAKEWFGHQNWKAHPFQLEAWESYLHKKQGIINAPTGSGKTLSLVVPILLESLLLEKDSPLFKNTKSKKRLLKTKNYRSKTSRLKAIWITPIRALATDIKISIELACQGLGVNWRAEIRTGDTSTKDKTNQKNNPPDFLITTPESLQLLISQNNYQDYFENLHAIVADEWHELVGSKRGVMLELSISRLRSIANNLKVWGISATIGNLPEALDVLLGDQATNENSLIIKADIQKKIKITSLEPDDLDTFPWGGHIGIKLLEKVIPIIEKSKTTLIFTNTRSQAEIWYQRLLEICPDLAGLIAMHHGSIAKEMRVWVEDALHKGTLKAVVCTSSLDLGVDFRPVETIIQIGGPKGVSRFMQRAGRSGHRPGEVSHIYFVPTQALEYIEASAIRHAIDTNDIEDRIPFIRSFDVLIQHLVTLAVAGGFKQDEIFEEVKKTFSYASISEDEWHWCLHFITSGGNTFDAYDEFKRVDYEYGWYVVTKRRIATLHRMSIGTIIGDGMVHVQYMSGKKLGTVEEYFISNINIGDTFMFAGKTLPLVSLKGMTAYVKKSKRNTKSTPAWQGGRMPLSSNLSSNLRIKMADAIANPDHRELKFVQPILDKQKNLSIVPTLDQFLIESMHTEEGHHLFFFPFEGRSVHEGMATLFAHRISQVKPISVSISMNDYGFELLSDQDIPLEEALEIGLLEYDNLLEDIEACLNFTELGRRRFREIAGISGLIFKGYPGKNVSTKHLQSNASVFFDVYKQYEPDSLLYKQTLEEILTFQLEEVRIRESLQRINQQEIVIKEIDQPTPFCFAIMVERIRERFTSESIEDRVARMLEAME